MTEPLLNALILFLVVIDPIGMAPIFVGLSPRSDAAHRRAMAIKGVVIACVVLVVFAVAGEMLMGALGITLPAFKVAGGVLLFLLAIDMVFARPSGLRGTTAPEDSEAAARPDISVFPLAVPLLAGPGAITSVMLATGQAAGDVGLQAALLGVMLAVMGLTLISLLLATRLSTILGVTGTNVIGRVLGIVLAALAAQYILDGLKGAGMVGGG